MASANAERGQVEWCDEESALHCPARGAHSQGCSVLTRASPQQEALQNFLSSWQQALAHMSRLHQDIPAAAEQLKTLRQTFTAHLVLTDFP